MLQLTANGLSFSCLTLGDGPLALLLHGFPDTPHTWLVVMEGLANAGFRAVAPAMRGYHPTDIPEDGDYRIPTLGRDALALITALGVESAAVIGHDWGATAAYAAANLGPERVTALVTLAIPPPRIIRPSLGLLFRAPHFAAFQLGPLSRWYARRGDLAYIDHLYTIWSPTWTDSRSHRDAIEADLRRPGRLKAALSYYQAMSAFLPNTVANTVVRRRISQPSLLFAGADDGALRIALDYAGVEGCFTGPMELVEVEGAGHFIQAEQPAAVLERLIPFLRDHLC